MKSFTRPGEETDKATMTLLLEQSVTQRMDEWMNVLGEGRNKVGQVEQASGEKPPREVWESAEGRAGVLVTQWTSVGFQ